MEKIGCNKTYAEFCTVFEVFEQPGELRVSDQHGSFVLREINGCLFLCDLALDGRDPSAMVRFASEARRIAQEQGREEVWLHVDLDNPRAKELLAVYEGRWNAKPQALILRIQLDSV